jgi:hypothetical protein
VIDHPCGRHRLVGQVLTGLLTLVLAAAGLAKLLGGPPPPDAPLVLAPTVVKVLGVIDLLLAAGLWVPRLSTLTYVLTVGYFGGATATNLTHGLPASFTAMTAALIAFTLLAGYFRSPELFMRLLGQQSMDEGAACAIPKKGA